MIADHGNSRQIKTCAKVATDTALDKTFDYLVPPEMRGRALPGCRVKVPFGRRTAEGYILALSDKTAFHGKLKPILEIIGDKPWLSGTILKMASWMSAYYISPIELCLQAVIPAPVRSASGTGFLTRTHVRLSGNTTDGNTQITDKRRKRIIGLLEENHEPKLSDFIAHAGTTREFIRKMASEGLVELFEKRIRRDPLAGRTYLKTPPPELNELQKDAVETIGKALDMAFDPSAESPKPILLFGVTASGKTEVYLRAIERVLAAGRSAIVLIPEISLTPQTVRRFASRFGSVTAILHSRLSDGERHDEWHRIYAGEAKVVVGPRSAVFAPAEKLGMIIVDEEHESSYKQDESPYYNARDIAVMRGRLDHCAVVLGSATPSLETWHNVSVGKYAIAEMPRRASPEMSRPRTVIVDMRNEAAKNNGVLPVFSEQLIEAVRERLSVGEQVMLFLNRRGFAPRVTCQNCGHTETCRNCSVGMTYHSDGNFLKCHVCGAERPVPRVCEQCGTVNYKYTGIGTQRIEAIARKIFPSAVIERMDADVTSKKKSHEEILSRFMAGKTDILIGTQMITKGLDFPNVTLAGVLNADASLNMPDFRAGERTFQLIAQMAGRTGRGIIPGDVYIQTLLPDAPAILYAARENFRDFAECEIKNRQMLNYPPFLRCTRITFSGEDRDKTEAFAKKFSNILSARIGTNAIMRGPTSAPLEKVKTMWRYQLTLLYGNPSAVLPQVKILLSECNTGKQIRIAVNVDAFGSN